MLDTATILGGAGLSGASVAEGEADAAARSGLVCLDHGCSRAGLPCASPGRAGLRADDVEPSRASCSPPAAKFRLVALLVVASGSPSCRVTWWIYAQSRSSSRMSSSRRLACSSSCSYCHLLEVQTVAQIAIPVAVATALHLLEAALPLPRPVTPVLIHSHQERGRSRGAERNRGKRQLSPGSLAAHVLGGGWKP